MKKILFLLLTIITSHVFADTTNWMSAIPNDRVFNQLIIPGTHDSGTYAITPQSQFSLTSSDALPIWIEEISNILPPSLVQLIVAGWSKTQPYSLTDQLNAGIRYLDFRVDFFQNQAVGHFYLAHTLLGARLTDALQQVQQFASAHPNEIVILDINHVYGVDNSTIQTHLIQLLQTYLGNNMIPNTYHTTDTIGTLRAHGNVIVLMDMSQPVDSPELAQCAATKLWHQSEINSPWANASNVTDLKGALDAEMAARAKMQSHTRLFVLQLIQTESTDQIIDGIIDPTHNPNNIQTYTAPLDADLGTWLNGYITLYGAPMLNIVIQDWFTNQSPIVPLATQYDTQASSPKQNAFVSADKLAALKAWFASLHH